MEAEDGDAGCVAQDGEGHASSGDPGNQDGRGGHEDPGRGGSRDAEFETTLETEVALALIASELGADAWAGAQDEPTATKPETHQLHFNFMVPFPSPIEADMASRLLIPYVQSLETPGVKEVTVSHNHLNVQLTGEDPFEIQTYVLTCLDQLSLMAFPACFFMEPTLEKEA